MAIGIVIGSASAPEININYDNKIFGISIDMNNSNPTTAVTYTDDAVGFSPLYCNQTTGITMWGSWKDIIEKVIGSKPCIYDTVNHSVICYLDPNDYSRTIDGAAVNIGTSCAGEVMVEFNKIYYCWARSGNTLTFRFSKSYFPGAITTAFMTDDGTRTEVDRIYYSAYEGYISNNKLHSWSGVSPINAQTITTYRTRATTNDARCGIESIVKRMLVIGLLFTVTKSRNSQTTIGMGNVSNPGSEDYVISTGTMDTRGLFYGTSSGSLNGCKIFGIENFWGNIYKWCDGLIIDTAGVVKFKDVGTFDTMGGDYWALEGVPGYGATAGWFYPKIEHPYAAGAIIMPNEFGGSSSTYFPDGYYLRTLSEIQSMANIIVCSVGGRNEVGLTNGPLYFRGAEYYYQYGVKFGARLLAA